MTPRERFNRIMRFQEVDRIPMLKFGPWTTTQQRWEREGMTDLDAEYAAFDGQMQNCWLYGSFQGPIPAFEETILREDEHTYDWRNARGQTERRMIETTSMPYFVDYPVKSRADWKDYRKRLDPDRPGRYPSDWDRLVRERDTVGAGEIRGVACWGFYGFPRELLGPENLSFMFYDDPGLIRDMNEYWTYFTVQRLEKAVTEMEFDYALIWEDCCYNHGMLSSPAVFREFMAPGYRVLVDFFRRHGIDLVSVDSDGNVNELIPLLLEVGVNAMNPFEVAAGMDVVKIGKEFSELRIWGGIDKPPALAKGKDAIDKELQRVIEPMKKRGGYGAGLDHLVPSDVSLENHRYYVRRLCELSKIR